MSSSQPGSADFFCSECSRAAGEQVFGTASPTDLWLALEYRGLWTRKAVADNGLPEAVRAFLQSGPAGVSMRPVLIRQPGRHTDEIMCYAGVVEEQEPRLYRFVLNGYEDLLTLDIAALVRGDAQYAAHLTDEPLYFVCTNGKRDRACSREGMPVYQSLAALDSAHTWQSTHLGGHRFAATALVLPAGALYGHLMPQDAENLWALSQRGQLDLAHLRGRTCYPKPVQAAAYYLRRETGEIDLMAFHLVSVEHEAESQWRVCFAAANGQLHEIQLAASDTLSVYLNSTDSEPASQAQYTLLEHATRPPQ